MRLCTVPVAHSHINFELLVFTIGLCIIQKLCSADSADLLPTIIIIIILLVKLTKKITSTVVGSFHSQFIHTTQSNAC